METQRPAWSPSSIIVALAAGAVLGGIVAAFAFLLARYGPTGDSWSFRGNGALAAYTLVPAFLAGGWTAVVLHHRRRRWAGLATAAVAMGLALALVDAALLPVFGPGGDQVLGPIVLLALAAWSVVAPVAAMFVPRGKAATGGTSIASSIAAAAALAVAFAAGLLLVGLAFPPGS